MSLNANALSIDDLEWLKQTRTDLGVYKNTSYSDSIEKKALAVEILINECEYGKATISQVSDAYESLQDLAHTSRGVIT